MTRRSSFQVIAVCLFSVLISPFVLLAEAQAQANCINLSGTYRIGGGKPSCAGTKNVVRQWLRVEQQNCDWVKDTKVYLLDDGSTCEGPTFIRVSGQPEILVPSTGHYLSEKFFPTEHISYFRHPTQSTQSYLQIRSLDQEGNLVLTVRYNNGTSSRMTWFRTSIR